MFGPDVPASVTTEELRLLVDGVRFVERMRAHPVDKDKDAAGDDVASLRDIFTKSLVAAGPLAAGHRPDGGPPRHEEAGYRYSGRASVERGGPTSATPARS